jgi:two-component system response regulator RegA
LLAEDDAVFAAAMSRALSRRGFDVVAADTAAAAMTLGRKRQPRYAVVDLKLGADSGLSLIPALRAEFPCMRILLLTGYASIATAVEAIKLGAHDYLAKPVGADAVVHALLDDTDAAAGEGDDTPGTPLPLRRLEWEHIHRTLHQCNGNISETARRLGMHRRTLQRKLDKHPVRERPFGESTVT